MSWDDVKITSESVHEFLKSINTDVIAKNAQEFLNEIDNEQHKIQIQKLNSNFSLNYKALEQITDNIYNNKTTEFESNFKSTGHIKSFVDKFDQNLKSKGEDVFFKLPTNKNKNNNFKSIDLTKEIKAA